MELHPFKTTQGFKEQLSLSSAEIEERGFKDGGIWFEETKTIICGTFPPKKEHINRMGYIHYSSPKNKFWQHIDGIYETNLFLDTENARNQKIRINNALKKIEFLKRKKIGFIDIFTEIKREIEDSHKDTDLIPVESIFDNKIFDDILKSNVTQIIFVYSLAKEEFLRELKKRYGKVKFEKVRDYGSNDITLGVERIIVNGKKIHLSYSPIHGNIKDIKRRPALRKAIENELN